MKNLEKNDHVEKEISIDQVLGKKWFALGSVVAALCSLCCFIASMGKISSIAMIMTYFTFGLVTAIALFMYDGARLNYRKVNGLKEYKFPFYGALYSASYFAITFLSFSNYAVYFPAMLALLFITGLALLFKKEPTKSVDVSLFTKVKSW